MQRGTLSRLLPIALVVIVIIVAIAAMISLGRAIFGGDDNQPASQTDTSRQSLLNTAADRSVRMTVRGPIVADENFRSYQIIVSNSQRSIVTYEGYLDKQIDSKSYPNNTKAYEEFVYALDKANMAKGAAFSGEKDDTRGICATGNVYEFQIMQANNSVKRLWTSTCSGSKGSLDANLKQLGDLFVGQVPGGQPLIDKIRLANTSPFSL